MQIALLLVVKINISAYILSQLQNNRRDSGCVSFFNNNMPAAVCLQSSVMRVSTKLALLQH